MRGKRLDIQGLRAIAVLLVFANHLFGWPIGGFVGVDVFFVISGFLITGHLVKEHEANGKWSFKSFYVKRARRILPAALTVTIVTVAASFVAFSWTRAGSILTDAVWATLFSANWRFITIGTDYMHADAAVSPLQHYWSLSIEEQFYFVWPLILAGALLLSVRRPRRGALIAIVVIGVVSFAFAIWETAANPTSAYFSTFSRVWELAVGALLAIVAPIAGRLPATSRPFIAWTGLALIALSATVLTPQSAFPGPWAILPVLGSAAVIAAGIDGEQRFLWPLRNRFVTYIGDISYSLYLWHFPVIIFTTLILAGTPRRAVIAAVVVSLLLSVISYHFIETPFRNAKLPVIRAWKPVVAFVGVVVVCIPLVAFAPRTSVPLATDPGPPITFVEATPALTARWADVAEAASATEWPTLTPPVSEMSNADLAPEWVEENCLVNLVNEELAPDVWTETAGRCTFGSGDKLAIIYGDSVALSWAPAIRAAIEPHGYRVQTLTAAQCPATDAETLDDKGKPIPTCATYRAWALDRIVSAQPSIIFASETGATAERMMSGATGADAVEEWASAVTRTVGRLGESGGRIVLLQPPPGGAPLDSCATAASTPSACMVVRSESLLTMLAGSALAAQNLDAEFIDTSSWFCNKDGRCPAFVGQSAVNVDTAHLTRQQSTSLAPVIADVIAP